jgi:ABC-type dipeptide/oligopeptide/nickel transport system permease component
MKAVGLPENRIIFTHVFKNALIPIVTIIGLQFGYLLGGAVIIEQIFGLPGLGKLILQSASAKDYPMIQAATLVITFWFVFINFGTDLLYAYLDPRIRYD